MKKTNFILILSLVTLLTSSYIAHKEIYQRNTKTHSQLNDQALVKATIERETAAYAKRDSALLVSFYLDDPITQSAWNNRDGTYGSFKGLDRIRKNFSDAFRKNPVIQYQTKIERNNWFSDH